MKVRAAYQEYDKELIEAQQKQQEIYNNAIPKVVTHQQNAYKVIKVPFTILYLIFFFQRAISATIDCMNDLKPEQEMELKQSIYNLNHISHDALLALGSCVVYIEL